MGANQAFIVDENGKIYFPIGSVAKLVGKSVQMIRLWDVWSDDLASNGSERLIPQSHRIGKNRVRAWTMEDINLIIAFSKNLKYGDMAKYSRTRWGEKANELTEDRSTEARQAKKEYREQVNTTAKKVQKEKKASEIKKAKGSMIKAIRKKAKSIYQDM